ncbi:helix-turn-helix transcriptional regulator [Cellulomonas sp. NPDC089187]|uniref:helix-turn-helix domain-containing protein n=1 Tax=Cellulomonas sp. NPDC089187 TaxID=3154970 RepID=UPI0034122DAB
MDRELHLTLGAALRAIRQQRGLSQEQLAHAVGYHRTFIGAVERGERNLTLSTVTELAGRLGVGWRDLLCGAPGADSAPPRD